MTKYSYLLKKKKVIKAYGAADRLSFQKKAIKEKFDKRKL